MERGDGKLSVLMPVYNEARTLRTIVQRVLDSPVDGDMELLVVDDGSTDRSPQVLRELASSDDRIVVLHHPTNRGKGAAIRTAITRMTGDIAVVQDSDLEYDPADFPRLLEADRGGPSRCSLRFSIRCEPRATGPSVLALPRESDPDMVHERPERSEPDRHGDLLQGRSRGHPEGPAAP